MAIEDGEWRIAEAPDALVVPESWFEQRFRQVSLYFFDPSAQILVPEPVFVQRGEPSTTALTEALLRGPGPELDGISRSFIPPGLDFDLSVPVSEEGVADIALRGYSGQLTPEASELMITQLAWTLRQEPDIEAIRVSIGGQQVTSASGQSLFDVDARSEYDPTGLDSSHAVLRPRRRAARVRAARRRWRRSSGPMGTRRLGARSFAVNLDGTTVAAVSAAGGAVLESSVRRSASSASRRSLSGAERPAAPGLGLRRPAVAGRRTRRRRRRAVPRRPGGRARSTCPGERPAGDRCSSSRATGPGWWPSCAAARATSSW